MTEAEKRKDRFRGCLIGGAIGDALGYPIEKAENKYLAVACASIIARFYFLEYFL